MALNTSPLMTATEIIETYRHSVVGPFLHRYGRFFAPQQLPSIYRRGAFRACFKNSYRMALRHPVIYVEGLGIANPEVPVGQLHAWCIDEFGRVLDRTWGRPGAVYFGIPFRTDYLRDVIDERSPKGDCYFGLLDDHEAGFPLIRNLGDKPGRWMAESPGYVE